MICISQSNNTGTLTKITLRQRHWRATHAGSGVITSIRSAKKENSLSACCFPFAHSLSAWDVSCSDYDMRSLRHWKFSAFFAKFIIIVKSINIYFIDLKNVFWAFHYKYFLSRLARDRIYRISLTVCIWDKCRIDKRKMRLQKQMINTNCINCKCNL